MKRLLIVGALVAASAFTFSWTANASPDPTCGGDTIAVPTPVGVACAAGDPAGQTGHAYADGNDTNPGASSGYIGVNSSEGAVGSCSGDYDRAENGANSPIDPTAPPSADCGP